MKFKQTKNIRKKQLKLKEDEFKTARIFAKAIYKEFNDFIKAVVLFGSIAKKNESKNGDIDILVIIDDVRLKMSEELIQTYRIILEKTVAKIDSKRLHIQSMKFTNFWEYVRAGDPVAINILRYGVALIDTGFFDPLQALLDEGRIRPSDESIYTYFVMAPTSINNAKQHLLSAMVDLYWGVIDAAHAALMKHGEIPPSPDHVADLMEKTLIKDKIISKKSTNTMREFYKIFKEIVHRDIKEIKGQEYDKYKKKAEEFVKEIKKYIDKKK
ncbi:MAG: nucleotidyltransferase domain-containing protein [Nanoarchaeota archaeon]|nr:nucleotidyltransferase domain-containing protein [Nanoarchaeota archaeon]